jgi:heme-degrading monooxygenase HmoA
MFARTVTLKLKKNSAPEFSRLIADEVIPLLRKQQGFREEISFVAPERSEALAISLWDTREDAEAYNRKGYAEVVKALAKVVEGTPKVQTFDVAHSTLPKTTAKTA